MSQPIIHHPRCRLCRSALRSDAEQLYRHTGNISRVVEYLAAEGDAISYNAVRNHLQSHIAPDTPEEVRDISTEESLKESASVVESLMRSLAKCADKQTSWPEKRRTAEAVNRLASNAAGIRLKLSQVTIKGAPAAHLFASLKEIMCDEANKASSPEIRQSLNRVLDQLQHRCGHLDISA